MTENNFDHFDVLAIKESLFYGSGGSSSQLWYVCSRCVHVLICEFRKEGKKNGVCSYVIINVYVFVAVCVIFYHFLKVCLQTYTLKNTFKILHMKN